MKPVPQGCPLHCAKGRRHIQEDTEQPCSPGECVKPRPRALASPFYGQRSELPSGGRSRWQGGGDTPSWRGEALAPALGLWSNEKLLTPKSALPLPSLYKVSLPVNKYSVARESKEGTRYRKEFFFAYLKFTFDHASHI